MVKVGMIGAGFTGGIHASSYANVPDTELVAIVDVDMKRAEELANRFNTKAYNNFQTMLNECKIDMIDVCLPTNLHKEYVLKAAKADKHVFCEKPLARSLEDAEVMIETCKSAEIKFMIGHVVRFFHEFVRAKQIIESGVIGKPGLVRTTRAAGFPTASQDWYADIDKSGGPILDLVSHDFDFLRWCFGEIERVYAKSLTYKKVKRTDYALIILRFKNGIIAHVEGSWAHPVGTFFTRLEVAGTQGLLEFDSRKATPIKVALKQEAGPFVGITIPESPVEEAPYTLQLKYFIKCIENDKEPMISGTEAMASLKVALAALESARTGKLVTLE